VDDDVLAANEAFYSAFNERDVDAMEALWAEESVAFCVHPGSRPIVGRAAIVESWRGILTNPAQPRLFAGAHLISRVGEVAIVVCSELVDGNLLTATNVFVREHGMWKMCHHQSGGVALGY